ncbi:MAG: endo-1,4-beta-xylanase [Cyanobacteria bacterium J06627_3]
MNNNDLTLRSVADKKNMTIGAAVKINRIRDDKQYRETVAREFNSITAEYEMKFKFMQPQQGKFNFRDSDDLMNFAKQNDMDLRGHALVWHIDNPEWLEKGNFSRQQLLNILETHIKTVVGRYKGQIKVWDVVNEVVDDNGNLRNSFWLQKIGPEYIELAFKWAHEADPDAKLLYNDYRIEEVNQKSNRAFQLVSDLKAKGVPIDGVGFQMHMSEDDPRNFTSVAENMKRLGNLGLEVQFTEADVRVKQPLTAARQANQAKIYQTIVETCAEAGNCDSVTIWGVTDRYSWIPGFFQGYDDALPFDENYRPKQAFNGLLSGFQNASVQTLSDNTPPESEGDIIDTPDVPPVDDTPETPEAPETPETPETPKDSGDMGNDKDVVDEDKNGNSGDGNDPGEGKTDDYAITAGDGNDFIQLGKGQDSVNAGNGNNKIYVRSANGMVDSSKNILTGTGNDKVHAGSGDDRLDLGTATNYDVAFGRGGSDTFVVNQGKGFLSIRDFEQGIDKLELNGPSIESIEQLTRNGKTWLSAGDDVLVEMTNFTGTLTAEDFVTAGNKAPDAGGDMGEGKDVVDNPKNDGGNNGDTNGPAPETGENNDNDGPDLGDGNDPGEVKTDDYAITAGDGNDFIQLGKGQDSVNAGNGNNKIYVRSANGMVNSSKDILTGNGNDKVHAGSGDDRLDLGTATNYDVAFGRGGSDTFVVNQGSGFLSIRDFEQGTDKLELDNGLSLGSLDQSSRNGKTWLSAGDDVLVEMTNFTGTLTAEDFVAAG